MITKSVCIPFLLLTVAACTETREVSSKPATTAEHVPYFAWISKDVCRGGQPKDEEAFRELAAIGVKTIVSVDGAKPAVEIAGKHGLRYVHIPIGYDTVPEASRMRLAKAARELEGPFFVHCHHGKHRGPAAAVLVQIARGGMTNPQAVAEMKTAGTAEKYRGLYAAVSGFVLPTAEETAGHEFDFPSVAAVPAFAEAMAVADRRFDNLKIVRKAGWKATDEHPDVAPAHEALQVFELFVEMGRTEDVTGRDDAFRKMFDDAEAASRDLETILRAPEVDESLAEEAFGRLSRSCSQCHTGYRN